MRRLLFAFKKNHEQNESVERFDHNDESISMVLRFHSECVIPVLKSHMKKFKGNMKLPKSIAREQNIMSQIRNYQILQFQLEYAKKRLRCSESLRRQWSKFEHVLVGSNPRKLYRRQEKAFSTLSQVAEKTDTILKDLTKQARRSGIVDEEEKMSESSISGSSLVKIEYRFSKNYTHAEYIITFDENVDNVPKVLICRFSQIKRLHESLCGEFIHVPELPPSGMTSFSIWGTKLMTKSFLDERSRLLEKYFTSLFEQDRYVKSEQMQKFLFYSDDDANKNRSDSVVVEEEKTDSTNSTKKKGRNVFNRVADFFKASPPKKANNKTKTQNDIDDDMTRSSEEPYWRNVRRATIHRDRRLPEKRAWNSFLFCAVNSIGNDVVIDERRKNQESTSPPPQASLSRMERLMKERKEKIQRDELKREQDERQRQEKMKKKQLRQRNAALVHRV